MKRIFSVLLVLCMLVGVFALTSCDKDDTPADTTADTSATTQSANADDTPAPALTYAEMGKIIFDSTKAYYDKHNAADNFEDITATSTSIYTNVSVEKLEYKDNPADIDEEVKFADHTNTFKTTTTTTFKSKTVDGVVYVEVKEDEKYEGDYYDSNLYVIEHTQETTSSVTTWTLAKIGEKYYYLVVAEYTDAEGTKTTTKSKYEFENATAYNEAVEDLLLRFNEQTMYYGFFTLISVSGELMMYIDVPVGGISFSKNGNSYIIGEKATMYGIDDRKTGVLITRDMDGTVSFTDGKAAKVESKISMKREGLDVNATNEDTRTLTVTYSSDLSTTVAEPDDSYTSGAWNVYGVSLPSAATYY